MRKHIQCDQDHHGGDWQGLKNDAQTPHELGGRDHIFVASNVQVFQKKDIIVAANMGGRPDIHEKCANRAEDETDEQGTTKESLLLRCNLDKFWAIGSIKKID